VKILISLAVVVGLISLLVMAKGYDDCRQRGGAYVKGAIWYECVATQP
jgi:hypothetical protein